MTKPAKKATRAAASARARMEDLFQLLPSGAIRIQAGGTRYDLVRPTIGEQRRFSEGLDELVRLERRSQGRDPETNDPPPEGWTPGPDTPTREEVNHALLNWWRDVVVTLGNGAALPDDDDELPPWLQQGTLVAEVRQHWLTVPWAPGSSPTERQAAEAKQLQPLLDTLAPLLAAAQAQQPTS